METGYLFSGDSYDTPPDAPRALMWRLLLGNRFYFYYHNFGVFCETARCGRRGELTKERQIAFSNRNFRLVESCGGRIHLRGLDNLVALHGRPVVLIGNHMSLLETALFHSILREHIDFSFVIKQELMKVPFFGEIMRVLEAIPVGRDNPRDDLRAVLTGGQGPAFAREVDYRVSAGDPERGVPAGAVQFDRDQTGQDRRCAGPAVCAQDRFSGERQILPRPRTGAPGAAGVV